METNETEQQRHSVLFITQNMSLLDGSVNDPKETVRYRCDAYDLSQKRTFKLG